MLLTENYLKRVIREEFENLQEEERLEELGPMGKAFAILSPILLAFGVHQGIDNAARSKVQKELAGTKAAMSDKSNRDVQDMIKIVQANEKKAREVLKGFGAEVPRGSMGNLGYRDKSLGYRDNIDKLTPDQLAAVYVNGSIDKEDANDYGIGHYYSPFYVTRTPNPDGTERVAVGIVYGAGSSHPSGEVIGTMNVPAAKKPVKERFNRRSK